MLLRNSHQHHLYPTTDISYCSLSQESSSCLRLRCIEVICRDCFVVLQSLPVQICASSTTGNLESHREALDGFSSKSTKSCWLCFRRLSEQLLLDSDIQSTTMHVIA